MLKELDWLNIAQIVSEQSINKSLTILLKFKTEIAKNDINDFLVQIISKIKSDDKDNILCSTHFINFLKEVSEESIWNYKDDKGMSLLRSVLFLLNDENNNFNLSQKEERVQKIDAVLEQILHFSNIEHISENLIMQTIDKFRDRKTVNMIQLLISLNMKKSLLMLVKKGFFIFDDNDKLNSISSAETLELYIHLGGDINKNIIVNNDIIPLWVLLLYKFSGYSTLSPSKRSLKDYIKKNVNKRSLREEEIRRYWLKWESDNDPAEYFDCINEWENLKTSDNQNVLIKLIEKRSSKINSLYRKKEFLNLLKEEDSNGKNIWGYLLGYYETKNNKLSEKIIPYLKENNIYPTIDKTGKGLIRQSKAMLDLSNKSNIEKIIISTFDNTVWLGDDEQQEDFANEILKICLSMDSIRYNEYKYLIDYMCDFINIRGVNKKLLYSIFIFYGIKGKKSEVFEDNISQLSMVCPLNFLDKQDYFITKISNNLSSGFIISKLKESKIYTKMIMKVISEHGNINDKANVYNKLDRI